MKQWARAGSLCFAAGVAGVLATWALAWVAARLGVSQALRMGVAPTLAGALLFRRVVWGGVFGAALLLPLPAAQWLRRGLLVALVPAAVQLLVVFPFVRHHGFLGLELGLATPFVVLFWSAVWGVAASWWHRLIQ